MGGREGMPDLGKGKGEVEKFQNSEEEGLRGAGDLNP